MIDYSTLKGLTIPEGAVKQITDSLGRVLWSAKPSEATVTITGEGSIRVMGKICAVTVDGVDYTSATTLVVPIGTVAICTVSTMSTGGLAEGWVKINGNTVLTASGLDETYDYTVSGNVTINMSTERNSDKDLNGYITITEQ